MKAVEAENLIFSYVSPESKSKSLSDVSVEIEKGEFIGGCEAGYFQGLGGKAFLFGNGDLALAHKPNEYMIVEDYFKYNELLLEIITELDKLILGGNYGI